MIVLPKLICRLMYNDYEYTSMCGLKTSKSRLVYYEDSCIDHCITLDVYLRYSGKASQ